MTRTIRTRIGLPIGFGAAMALFLVVAAGCGQQKSSMTDNTQQPAPDQTQAQTGTSDQGAPGQPAPGDAAAGKRVPQTAVHTLPAGTVIVTTLENIIDTGKNHAGDPVHLRTTEAVHVDGVDVVPPGSIIRGTVTHVDPAGRVAGGAELTLRFTELILPNGKSYAIDAHPLVMHGKGEAKHSAEEIGGGAAAGGILGAIIGGKDGVLKGAAAGAVVGTGVAVATKGKQIVLGVGQKIRVDLMSPVEVSGRVTS